MRRVYSNNEVEWIYLKTGMTMLPVGRYVATVLNVVTASAIPLRYIARSITFGYSKLFYVKQFKTFDYICPKAHVIRGEFCCG